MKSAFPTGNDICAPCHTEIDLRLFSQPRRNFVGTKVLFVKFISFSHMKDGERGRLHTEKKNFNQMALSSKIHSSYSTNNVFLLCPASLTCVFSLLNSPHSCTQAHTSPPLIRQSNSVPPIHTSICFMANTILMTRNRANTMCICVQHCKD